MSDHNKKIVINFFIQLWYDESNVQIPCDGYHVTNLSQQQQKTCTLRPKFSVSDNGWDLEREKKKEILIDARSD
jgi:hypothetical protein